jgi:hypothetical protein
VLLYEVSAYLFDFGFFILRRTADGGDDGETGKVKSVNSQTSWMKYVIRL